ncbi:MAG: ComF family protein [Lachnospiraceae bacterium]
MQKALWPEVCPFCGKASASGICLVCRKKLEGLRVKEPCCMKCGKPIRYFWQEYCYDCQHTYHYYDQGKALWVHSVPVSQSIYRFKFHNQRVFAKYYAEETAIYLLKNVQRWKPDILIPIPIHPVKRRKRGYNQAEILTTELGKKLGISVNKTILKRIKNTKPQKKLGSGERKKNLKNAFQITDEQKDTFLAGKRILLVDDIYTTGSTIDAAAKTLKEAGAEKVYYLTISIGQGY